jgi:molecular chaperone DnaJ
MAKRDPYEVLGIARGASADDLKSAYRRLARRYHPDVNPNDPEAEDKFKEVGEAYSILSDPDRRLRFDQYGVTDDQPTDPFGGMGGVSDLFDMFFGGMGQQSAGRRRQGRDGQDIQAQVELTLKEVITGLEREITVERDTECSFCHGTGAEGGKQPETCTTCRGQGVITSVRNTFIGQVRTQTACPTCGGQGTIVKDPCRHCKGIGVTSEAAKVGLKIPPGVDDGATMHLPGQGGEGTGAGRPGDLYVVLRVKADKRFERRGQTLVTGVNLTFAQASLGDHFDIEGVDEVLPLNIESGTQPGTQIVIKGAGLPPLHGGRRGDLVVEARVKVPSKLNEAQVKLIKELAEVSGEPIPKGDEKSGFLGGLFSKKK